MEPLCEEWLSDVTGEAQLPQRYRASAVITPLKVIQGHWCYSIIRKPINATSYLSIILTHIFFSSYVQYQSNYCLFFALFLGNLCKYHHKSYIAED